MADAVKSVVLKLALEFERKKLDAPDLAPLLDVEKKITQTVQQESVKRSEEVKKSRIFDIAVHEQYFASLRAQMAREAEDGGRIISKAREEQSRAWAAARAMHEDEEQKLGRVREGWLALAEAALKFGRSAALASTNANGDLTELIGTLAKFQAGLDAVSGAKSSIEGIGKAFGMSETAIAGLVTKLHAAAVIAGVIAGTGYVIYKLINMEADAQENANRIAAQRGKAPGVKGPGGQVQLIGGEADADFQQIQALQRADEAKRDADLRERLAGAGARFGIRDEQRAGFPDAQKLRDIDAERVKLRKDLKEIQDSNFQSAEAKLQAQLVITERQKQLEAQRVELLKQQGAELAANLAKQQAAVKAAQDAVDAEEARLKSIEEKIGNLSELEQAELKSIADKIEEGTASAADIKRAATLAPDIYGDRAAREAQNRGRDLAADLFRREKGFEITQDRDVAESQRDNLENTGNNAKGKTANQMASEVEDMAERLRKAEEQYHKAVIDALQAQEKRRIQQAKEVNAARAAQS